MSETWEDRVAELEDELAEVRLECTTLEEESASLYSIDDLVEVECRRCHVRFRSLPDVQWCTRDCEMGWTSAPSFEQYYATLHKA